MATFGSIGEFDYTVESWQQYEERLDHFLVANCTTDAAKKCSCLIATIGPATYQLLSSLVAPDKPGDKDYKTLVKILQDHYNPKPLEIVQRYKFHTRSRQPSETMAKFVAALRSIAQYCNFGDSLNDLLRDRLVCGVNDDGVQHRLLSEKGLTFAKAFDIASSMEAAKKIYRSYKLQRRNQISKY